MPAHTIFHTHPIATKAVCLAAAFLTLSLIFLSPTFQTKADNYDTTFGAETFMLDNGMQAIVIPNHRVPVVTHMLW